ncbi:hypothetical protein VTN77DRAFT_7371 [Rasamsonia byssochlamydoides]|uniref:uncharacterized protein n=1 Tax=Rasamsonia byssochlamydoides TaxID=89139 RepID=UPI0037421181
MKRMEPGGNRAYNKSTLVVKVDILDSFRALVKQEKTKLSCFGFNARIRLQSLRQKLLGQKSFLCTL